MPVERSESATDRLQQSSSDRAKSMRSDPNPEHVLLRSYDHRRGYDLRIEVERENGTPAVRKRYYLQPGESLSERLPVEDGPFPVTVVLDDAKRQTVDCRIGDAADETLVVEVGNGILSVTEGLHG